MIICRGTPSAPLLHCEDLSDAFFLFFSLLLLLLSSQCPLSPHICGLHGRTTASGHSRSLQRLVALSQSLHPNPKHSHPSRRNIRPRVCASSLRSLKTPGKDEVLLYMCFFMVSVMLLPWFWIVIILHDMPAKLCAVLDLCTDIFSSSSSEMLTNDSFSLNCCFLSFFFFASSFFYIYLDSGRVLVLLAIDTANPL